MFINVALTIPLPIKKPYKRSFFEADTDVGENSNVRAGHYDGIYISNF